jgi:hypothetical protein
MHNGSGDSRGPFGPALEVKSEDVGLASTAFVAGKSKSEDFGLASTAFVAVKSENEDFGLASPAFVARKAKSADFGLASTATVAGPGRGRVWSWRRRHLLPGGIEVDGIVAGKGSKRGVWSFHR